MRPEVQEAYRKQAQEHGWVAGGTYLAAIIAAEAPDYQELVEAAGEAEPVVRARAADAHEEGLRERAADERRIADRLESALEKVKGA